MKKIRIDSLIRPNIRALRGYEAKEIACRIKLDANESPYGFALPADIRNIPTNRYPDPEARALRAALSRFHGVSAENIIVGNGSDELIYYLITTFGGPVLFPVPTFSMYGIIATALGQKVVSVPLDCSFDIEGEKTNSAVRKYRPKLVFLSSPNNPTGNCFSSEKILSIVESSKGLVVIDEAYAPFASEKGFVPLLKDYENMIILRTLSKIGLAGLRVGYLLASEEIIRAVNKVRLPFNVNSYSQAIALSVIKNKKPMIDAVRSIVTERQRLIEALSAIKGVRPFPSEANFILFEVEKAAKVYKGLLKKGILVRDISSAVPSCLRVTVGSRKENDIFINALKEVME